MNEPKMKSFSVQNLLRKTLQETGSKSSSYESRVTIWIKFQSSSTIVTTFFFSFSSPWTVFHAGIYRNRVLPMKGQDLFWGRWRVRISKDKIECLRIKRIRMNGRDHSQDTCPFLFLIRRSETLLSWAIQGLGIKGAGLVVLFFDLMALDSSLQMRSTVEIGMYRTVMAYSGTCQHCGRFSGVR